MPGTHRSRQESDEIAAQLAAAEQSDLPLFGLAGREPGSRALNGIGWRDDVVNQVTLARRLSSGARIDVTVIGPLHGREAGGEWSIDPMAAIAVELLNHAGVEIASTAEMKNGATALLQQGFGDIQVRVDGRAWPFRLLRKGNHWAALHDLKPHHLLYVVAGNTAPADIELKRLANLSAYAQPLPD